MAPDLQTRLAQGMTFAQLLERSRHASLLLAFLEAAPPEPLPEEVAWVLALVEDWCPDCHQAAPVLAKAAGERARFFFRDENPDLREAYRLGEKRIVPTLVFLDRELKELARWHGPPEEARAFFRARLAEGAPASREEKRALLAAYHRAFPRMAKAIREEWARLLRRASGPPG
jgi:thiol-disulfide isomerase/thioredoxin